MDLLTSELYDADEILRYGIIAYYVMKMWVGRTLNNLIRIVLIIVLGNSGAPHLFPHPSYT
jgi:hypothetical protein